MAETEKPPEPKKQPKDWVPKELADWMMAGMRAYAADPDKYDREQAEWESNVKVKQFSEEKDDDDNDADVIDEPYWNKGEDESAATEPEGAPEPEVPDEMPKAPEAEGSPFAGRKSVKAFVRREDKLGRTYCTDGGVRVACGPSKLANRPLPQAPNLRGQTYKVPARSTTGTVPKQGESKLPPLAELPKLTPPSSNAELPKWLAEVKKHPYIAEAEKLLRKDRRTTAETYRNPDGTWKRERVDAVHEPIIRSFFDERAKVPPGEAPKFLMLIGKFGAGKSTAGGQFVKKIMPNYVLVNPDEIKNKMPEDEGWNATNIHEESSYISGEVQRRALQGRYHTLYDGSGQNADNMKQRAALFAKAGYEVHVVHVTVPDETSVFRAASRFLENPFKVAAQDKPPSRYAPLDYVLEVDGGPDKTYEALKKDPNVKSGISLANVRPLGQPPEELDRFER